MTLLEFSNGLRVLWNISRADYLACINDEDREFFGEEELWKAFAKDAHKTFVGLPTQDQERVFAIITERNRNIHPALRNFVNSISP